MTSAYYLAIITSLEIDGGEITAIDILKAFFAEGVWLFPEKTPSVKSLKKGDKILVYGPYKNQNCVLGQFTLKTKPQEQERPFANIKRQLSNQFSFSSEISDSVIWDTPRPLGELVPELAVFDNPKYATFYLSSTLRPLAKEEFEKIIRAEGTFAETIQRVVEPSDAHPPSDVVSPEFDEQSYNIALETAQWFQELISPELAEKAESLKDVTEQLTQIPLFRRELETLRSITQAQSRTVAVLQQEMRVKNETLEQIQKELEERNQMLITMRTTFDAERESFKSERKNLFAEIEALQSKLTESENRLEQIGTVKKALQCIIGLLRNRGRDAQ